jgi:hypothetical protein
MKYAVMKYGICFNLGDNIQSIAAEAFLPRIDLKIDRDKLRETAIGEKTVLIMNGWFAQAPQNSFPPHPDIVPVFFGFHVTPDCCAHILSGESRAYLKKHEPIGCRDRTTCELLEQRGVKAFYSRCVTLTFPRRTAFPQDGIIFMVDAEGIPLPSSLREKACYVSHSVDSKLPDQTKDAYARALLAAYRDHARLVITTKIHCAMPCIAMGIPVLYFGNAQDSRIEVMKDLGLKVYPYNELGGRFGAKIFRYASRRYSGYRYKDVDWDPQPLDIRSIQEEVRANLRKRIEAAVTAAA